MNVDFKIHHGLDHHDIDEIRLTSEFGGRASLGDMCCTLGHLNIWRCISQSNSPALILEDDARPGLALANWVNHRAEAALQALSVQILKLEAWGGKGRNRAAPFGRASKLDDVFLLKGRFMGSAAYVMTPEAARAGLKKAWGRPVDQILFAPPFVLGPVAFAAPAPVLHDVGRWGTDIERRPAKRPPRSEYLLARARGARRIPVCFQDSL